MEAPTPASSTSSSGNTMPGVGNEDIHGVDVDYIHPVAPQIEKFVLRHINSSTTFIVHFLKEELNCLDEEISPFAIPFIDFQDLAREYFNYLGSDTQKELVGCGHSFGTSRSPRESQALVKIDEANETLGTLADDSDDAVDEELLMRVAQFNVQFQDEEDLRETESYVSPLTAMMDEMSLVQREDKANMIWPLLSEVMQSSFQQQRSVSFQKKVLQCIDAFSFKKHTSSNDSQKFKSLQGRWFGVSVRNVSSEVGVKRGMLFQMAIKTRFGATVSKKREFKVTYTYRILNVFQKSYNKWRLERSGPANKSSKVHAVAVSLNPLRPDTYNIDKAVPIEDRYRVFSGLGRVRFAIIEQEEWMEGL